MKKQIVNSIVFLFAAAALVTGLSGCGESTANSKNAQSDTTEQAPAKENDRQHVLVKVEELSYEPYRSFVQVFGVVKPYQVSQVASATGGKIKSIEKEKGDYVNKGDVMVILDNDVLKANMESAKAQYDLAEIRYKKQEEVYKQNVTSEIQYLESKYLMETQKAQYELLKSQYEDTFIKAPFSGIIDQDFYEEGEVATPGMPIVTVLNSSRVKIEAGVPENFVNDITRGDPVKLVFSDLGGYEVESKVSYVGRSINKDNRTFPIEVAISNSDYKVKPELNVEVYIQTGVYEKAIVIDENVAVRTDLGYVVFVAKDDNTAEMRTVDIISRRDDKVAVSKGLDEGDRLIVTGYQSLVDGEQVKIVE